MRGQTGLPRPAGPGIASLPSRFQVHVCLITPSQLSTELKRYLGRLALYADLLGRSCTIVECSTYTDSLHTEPLTVSSVRYSGARCTKDTGVQASRLFSQWKLSPVT